MPRPDGTTTPASPVIVEPVAPTGVVPVPSKLAEKVASRIIADIRARGWPVGEVLGSETELLERYGVSRAVFREAVRLLEHQRIARMRRGPGGGLVIEAPSVESVVEAMAIYLFSVRAERGEARQARLALTVASVPPGGAREIANPALEFLVDLLERIEVDRKPATGLQQVRAFEAAGRSDKRGQQLARQILVEVYAGGWEVGALLGSEASLMERYGVSRAVLREAVRVLEHHQVAAMRRGPGGGLFVTQPDLAAITEAFALCFDRLGVDQGQLAEVRTAVDQAIAERKGGNQVLELLSVVLSRVTGGAPAPR